MNLREIAEELGLNYSGEYGKNNSYVIDLYTDKEFGKVYSLFDRNEEVEQLEENNLLTVHNASLIYLYKDRYQINLKSNFDTDEYSIILTDLGEQND